MNDRREAIASRIVAAGLPSPETVIIGRTEDSIAVAFMLDGVIHTIEGCGASDAGRADDVARQLRELLARRQGGN